MILKRGLPRGNATFTNTRISLVPSFTNTHANWRRNEDGSTAARLLDTLLASSRTRRFQATKLRSTSTPTIPIECVHWTPTVASATGFWKSTLLIEVDRSADSTKNYSPSDRLLGQIRVRGINIDSQTRCAHYHGPTDIISIKMRCCGHYFACKDCHEELARHCIEVWPVSEWEEKAIPCGICLTEMSITEYLQCEYQCVNC